MVSKFRLLKQNTTDGVTYKQQKFISHSLGVGKSKVKTVLWSRSNNEGSLSGS